MKQQGEPKQKKYAASVVQRYQKAYAAIDKRITEKIKTLPWTANPKGAWEERWNLIDKLNAEYSKIPRPIQLLMAGYRGSSSVSMVNETIAKQRLYKKEIEKGVYARDLIQPLDEKGDPNPDFVEHYGIANYTPEQKEKIRDTMGRDPNREKDWRSVKK